MAELPNPNPNPRNELGQFVSADSEAGKRSQTQLDFIKESRFELSGIGDSLKALNDNFMSFTEAWIDSMDDEARARAEALMEERGRQDTSGNTAGGNKKFEMPDLTGGFGLGPVLLVGLAAIFTELDTVFQAIVIGVKSMMATLRGFMSLILRPFREGGRFFGIVTKIGGFIDKLVGKDSFFGKFLRFITKITGLSAIVGKIAGPLAMVGAKIGRFIPFVQIIMGIVDFVKGFIDKFSKADNFGEGVLEGIFGGITEVINGLIMKPLDLLKEGAIWLAKKLGADAVVKLLESFSFSDMFKTAVNWLYDTDTNVWFGGFFAGVPARVGKLFTDMTTAIGSFFTEYIYDGENNKIFGMEIPKLLFEFNFFNVIKETIDDVIKTVTAIFSGDFSLKTLLKGGLALFDLATAGINLAVNAIIDIFSWGDKKEGESKKPFRLSDFIFGPDGIIMKAKNFFYHEDGKSGLFNLNLEEKGKDFTLLNIIDELIEKVSKFFTDLFSIDINAMLDSVLPDNLAGNALRKAAGITVQDKPIALKDQTLDDAEEMGLYEGNIVGDSTINREGLKTGIESGKVGKEMLQSIIDDNDLSKQDLEFMKKLQGDMATFTKKATTGNSIFVHDISVEDALGKTTDSLEKTAEISIGSAANSNSPVVIAGPSVSTGGGQSPGAGGSNTTVVNNSSKKTETRVSLADRVRPEQQFMHKFGAM